MIESPRIGENPGDVGGGAPWWNAYAVVEVDLGVGGEGGTKPRAVWNSSHWDAPTANWAGTEPAWVTVSQCRLIDVSIDRGRARSFDRFGASSASFTFDDPDGALSWDSSTDEDTLDVRAGRPIRVRGRSVPHGTEVVLWNGFVESIEDAFAPWSRPAAKITAQDALAQIAHVDLPEVAPVGGGERSDQRVARLLDLAEWPNEWRDLDVGRVTVQATNLARNLVDDLGITADSEGGALFATRDGDIAFRNRDWLRTRPEAATVQATIGDDDDDVCAASYALVRTGADIVNDVQLARAGGTMRRFVDEASVAYYRRRTFQRSDYVCETDAQVDLLGGRIIAARGSGQVRITKLSIACVDVATFDFALAVDYGWRLVVSWEPDPVSPNAPPWSREVHVQGVSHRIGVDGWTLDLRVDDAFASAADTWNGPNGWDVATWAVAT